MHSYAKCGSDHGDDGTNDLLVSGILHTNELQVWFPGHTGAWRSVGGRTDYGMAPARLRDGRGGGARVTQYRTRRNGHANE